MIRAEWKSASNWRWLCILLLLTTLVPALHRQSDTEFDAHKVRISGFGFYSNPTGTVRGSDDTTGISLQKNFGFIGRSDEFVEPGVVHGRFGMAVQANTDGADVLPAPELHNV